MIDEAYRRRLPNVIRLQKKGLSPELAAAIVLGNATHLVDNSIKLRDVKNGINSHYDNVANKIILTGNGIIDVKDVGEPMLEYIKNLRLVQPSDNLRITIPILITDK